MKVFTLPALAITEEPDGRIGVAVHALKTVLTCEEFREMVGDCAGYIARRVRRENEEPKGVA